MKPRQLYWYSEYWSPNSMKNSSWYSANPSAYSKEWSKIAKELTGSVEVEKIPIWWYL